MLNVGARGLEDHLSGSEVGEKTASLTSPWPEIRTPTELRSLLSTDAGVNALLALESSVVPAMVDLLQSEIRALASDPDSTPYRIKCAKCLRVLVNKHHVLPGSLFVNEITKEGTHPLGGGGFSDIWKGRSKDQSLCLKVLRIHVQGDLRKREKVAKEFYKEALLWTQLSHPNLLPLLGVNTTLFPQGFCLVSPWMVNGDVITFLSLNTDHDRFTAILEIAAGMAYLHSLKIVHGDIKGANVLVNEQGRCHLADFGLAVTAAGTTSLVTTSTSNTRGSLRWMAPELFRLGGDNSFANNEIQKPKTTTFARDIYAFACTGLEVSFHALYDNQK
ncbi:serine/threonine protein kinase, AGC [Marasmius crinis-equi]|uniref:Serine/threonine protein kinase, AGC n=1 Tax=Marasmius crinis-equi TaxID=585013 RepID=A0ABR3F807_9AGAR